jgi:ferredoxin
VANNYIFRSFTLLINKLLLIYFSPTHSTAQIVQAMARGWNIPEQRTINLNSIKQRHNFQFTLKPSEAVILGIPTYQERIPNLLYPVLHKIIGNNDPMVLVATYGNISAGITLRELYKLMSHQGFKIIAAANFISEHSFFQGEIKIASGRPDQQDLEKAELFGKQIRQKMEATENLEKVPELNIKGKLLTINKLLPEYSELLFSHAPQIDVQLCQHCRKCLEACPVNAINPNNLKSRDKLCIHCMACVKTCPAQARKIVYKKQWLTKAWLNIVGKKRKEPVIYI